MLQVNNYYYGNYSPNFKKRLVIADNPETKAAIENCTTFTLSNIRDIRNLLKHTTFFNGLLKYVDDKLLFGITIPKEFERQFADIKSICLDEDGKVMDGYTPAIIEPELVFDSLVDEFKYIDSRTNGGEFYLRKAENADNNVPNETEYDLFVGCSNEMCASSGSRRAKVYTHINDSCRQIKDFLTSLIDFERQIKKNDIIVTNENIRDTLLQEIYGNN